MNIKSIYEFLLKNKTGVSTQQNNDYVDLGLPSGLLWARCNIGAYKPTDYGDYFMWGSTKTNTSDSCNWAHAPFNNGYIKFNKEYFKQVQNKVCPNGILAAEYDAASIIMGNDWRLPTDNEFQELIDNTKHEWVENYQGSNVNGMVFTPVVFTPVVFTPVVFTPKNIEADKANGNDLGAELFIPAAGCCDGSDLYDRGDHVYLWSSSLFTSSPNYAKYFYLDDSYCYMCSSGRFLAYCLRGVKET